MKLQELRRYIARRVKRESFGNNRDWTTQDRLAWYMIAVDEARKYFPHTISFRIDKVKKR